MPPPYPTAPREHWRRRVSSPTFQPIAARRKCGEGQRKDAFPAPGVLLDTEATAHRVDEPFADREPETAAFFGRSRSDFLSWKNSSKIMGDVLRGDPDARIGDRDLAVPAPFLMSICARPPVSVT